MTTEPKKILYSITETINAIGLGRTKIYREIKEGRLLALKSGKRTLIPATAIQEWQSKLRNINS